MDIARREEGGGSTLIHSFLACFVDTTGAIPELEIVKQSHTLPQKVIPEKYEYPLSDPRKI